MSLTSVEPEPQTIAPVTVHRPITALEPTITANNGPGSQIEDELPTEVIAEALAISINILRPVDGQWLIDVTAFGHAGHTGVGDLSDGLLAASAWIEELALRWQSRLDGDE